MSEEFFEKEIMLSLSKTRSPVLFAHKKNIGHPKSYLLHLNNYIEIYVYVSGDADYIVEGHYIPLTRGDVVVILPHEVHVPVIKSEGVDERFYMLLPFDAFADLEFDAFAHYRTSEGHRLPLSPQDKERLFGILYRISALHGAEDTQSTRLLATALFLEAQSILSAAGGAKGSLPDVEIVSGIPKHLREILKHIGLHAHEICSVEELAQQFYLSPQYLSSLFKKHVGVNVNHYLRIKKIAMAKQLLEQGCSVAEACYECGFSDSSHFIKTFKGYVGMTPKQYKQALQGSPLMPAIASR